MDGTVETERLILRPWRETDLDPLVEVFAKPDFWWYPDQRGWTAAETADFLDAKLEQWATRGWAQWAVVYKPDVLIGFLGLMPPAFLPEVMPTVEIGWRLDPDYWGRGLATEGGHAGLRFGFETLGLDHLVSIYEPENVASGRVMQHLGMHLFLETVHPELGVDLHVYRLTADEWRAQRATAS
jgi:RimJ/RimL family protein N-acetyltransferase